jgi:hypothetical protein
MKQMVQKCLSVANSKNSMGILSLLADLIHTFGTIDPMLFEKTTCYAIANLLASDQV